jgi:hypothetical protein
LTVPTAELLARFQLDRPSGLVEGKEALSLPFCCRKCSDGDINGGHLDLIGETSPQKKDLSDVNLIVVFVMKVILHLRLERARDRARQRKPTDYPGNAVFPAASPSSA